jgi:hypothetical protein
MFISFVVMRCMGDGSQARELAQLKRTVAALSSPPQMPPPPQQQQQQQQQRQQQEGLQQLPEWAEIYDLELSPDGSSGSGGQSRKQLGVFVGKTQRQVSATFLC